MALPMSPSPANTGARRYLVLALVALLVLTGCARGATPTPTLPTVSGTPGLPPLPGGDERKIDPILLEILHVYRQQGQAAAEQLARESGVLADDNIVRLSLVLTDTNTQPVAAKVQDLGGTVTSASGNLLEIAVPLGALVSYVGADGKNSLQDLAAFETVREVQVTRPMREHDLGLPRDLPAGERRARLARVISEGVEASGAAAWHAAGLTGQGVRIGIIDVGFGGYEALLGQELPPEERVHTRSFSGDRGLGDEIHGTAVAEIVHGMAPDAEIWLARIDTTATTDRAVRWLVDEVGVQLISMSIGRVGFDRQDGTSLGARAVDYAYSRGVLCIVSAGNSADEHYAAPFTDADGDGYHEFAEGKQDLLVTAYADSFDVVLNWEAWSGPAVNLDLEVYDTEGNLLRASNTVQTTGGRGPVESIVLPTRQRKTFVVRIKGVDNPPPVPLQIFTVGSTPEILTPEGSLATPADATHAFTVGAIRWDTDRLEDYSSQGPRVDGLLKPDIAGQSVVSTAVYAGQRPPTKFNGTSAAAPHVSGAAALFLAANPGATPDDIRAFLQGRAIDLEEPGPDNKTGAGALQLGAPPQGGAPGVLPTPPARASVTPARATATTARATATATPPPPTPTPTPTPPTATATPTPPPVPTARGRRDPAFADPFSGPSTGLPDGGEGRYIDGRYAITPDAPDRAAWSVYGLHYADATIEATVQIAAGVPGAAGLVFWQGGPDDYHLFAISDDGYFQVARYVGGRWIALIPWTRSPAVTPNGPNALKVTTAGARITVAVNGQDLGTIDAAGAGGGQVGFLAASFARAGLTATFGDFRVTPGP